MRETNLKNEKNTKNLIFGTVSGCNEAEQLRSPKSTSKAFIKYTYQISTS